MGLNDLLTEMHRRGLSSRRSKKLLSLTALSSMLNNPFYIGIVRIKRTNTTYQGKHEPIITKALFDRVQAILRGKLFARAYRHDYLFRRMVRCAECGYHLIGEQQKRRYIYYRCHTPTCKGVSIREDVLDHVMQTHLALLRWDAREQQRAREVAAEMAGDTVAEIEKVRGSLRLRLAHCEERIERLTDAYLDEALDKELFEGRKRRLFGEKRDLLDQIEQTAATDIPINRALEKLELGNAAYQSYRIGIRQEKRDVVESVTSNFVAQGKEPVITLKSPYAEVANWRKTHFGAASQGRPVERARKLLEIALAVAQEEKKTSVSKADLKRAA
jgi:hypothetical protein